MRVIIAGGTGLIGRALSRSLVGEGHETIVLTRSASNAQKQAVPGVRLIEWDGKSATGWGELADGADAIVNLAGESLGGGRWTKARKQRILESRTNAGAAVMDAIRAANVKPRLLVQASAVGIYGKHGDDIVAEQTSPGTDFQSRVVWEWEMSTAAATRLGVRRVVARTGLPFSTEGGVFPLFLLPFRTFMIAGGKLGNGEQYVPWLHIDDHIRALRFLMANEKADGPFNLSSPNPVQQKELATALGDILGRPSFMPAPAFAMKAVLGEMSTIVLNGWRESPQRLLEMGFTFNWPDLRPALRSLLKRPDKQAAISDSTSDGLTSDK